MFNEKLTTTALTTDNADAFYRKVELVQDEFRDRTLLSTIRAVIAPRMSDDESIRVATSVYTPTRCRTNIGLYPGTESWGNYIDVVLFGGSAGSDSYAASNTLADEMCVNGDGEWSKLEKVTVFFRKVMNISVYISPKYKAVKVFIDGVDARKYHLFQSAIFALFPWFMGDEKELSDLDKRVIESLNKRDPQMYIDIMNEISEKLQIELSAMRNALVGFESSQLVAAKNNLMRQIEDIMRNIKIYDDTIRQWYEQKRDLDIRVLGYTTALSQGGKNDSELFDYFVRNKNLKFISTYNNKIRFVTTGYLELIDEDLAENVISNRRSYVYGRERFMSNDDLELFMRAVFLDKKFKIRSCAAYDLSTTWVEALSGYDYGSSFYGYYPNPHTDNYSCMGDYKRVIEQCLISGDMISAVEQCIASNNSLNFGDSVVMNKFMEGIVRNAKGRCVELPDGTYTDVLGAVTYLKGASNE